MKEIKFRIPVICQNGHKALFYYEIKNKNPEDICEFRSIGVPDDQDCDCPKYSLEEGWRRNGEDQQFTGLKDKNGVEIYEGDILDAKDRLVKVVWHERAGQWDTDFICYKGTLSSSGLLNSEWEFRAKKIGNIYENPELLTKKQSTS